MKTIAACTYTFVFDPGDTWSHLYQFEKSLAKYLESDGLEMQIIEPMGAGVAGKMIHIYPKPTLEPINPPKQTTTPAGVQIRKLGKIGKK